MDARPIDRLARSLVSRRAGFGLALASLLGAAGAASNTAAKRKPEQCGACRKRVKGRCKPKADGTPCGPSLECQGGKCKPTGPCGSGETVCGAFCCTEGQVCQETFCSPCGGLIQPCCPGETCNAGLVCAFGTFCGPPM